MSRRAFGSLAAAFALVGVVGLAGPAEAARPKPLATLPTPSPVVVSGVTARSISLKIGGSTVKTYNVFVNGAINKYATPSSASVPLTVDFLESNTTYAITVQETNTRFETSALTQPLSVRTLVSTAVAPVTNLRLVSVTPTSITAAWNAAATSGVTYDIYLNGLLVTSSNRTQETILGKWGYPNLLPGTGPKPGNNVVGVRARSTAAASLGETSAIVELVVFVPSA